MEDLKRYLNEIVDPTIADFETDPTSVRQAFLTCVAVFHAIDYLAFPRKSRILRTAFRRQSPEFAIVDQVAHAFKHVRTGGLTSMNAAQVIARPPAMAGVMMVGLSLTGDGTEGVTLAEDTTVDLLTVVKSAVAFLRTHTSPIPKAQKSSPPA